MATLSTSRFRKGFCTFLCIVVSTSLSAQSVVWRIWLMGIAYLHDYARLSPSHLRCRGIRGLIGLTT